MSRFKHHYLPVVSLLGIFIYIYSYYTYGFVNSKFGADLAALIGLAFMGASTTYPAIKAIKNWVRSDTDKFILSYWSVWMVFLFHRLWVIYLSVWNTEGNEAMYQFLRQSPISGLIAIMIAVSAAHGAVAPFSGSIELRKRDLIIFTAAGTFSGIIAGTAVAVFWLVGWN